MVNPTLYSKVPHEFEKDFNLVSLAVLTTLVIVVHPSVPAHTVNDLVGLIKANPGRCSYASPGTGTPGHLVGETFRLSQGRDLVHVPFNSAGLAVGSAVAGHTPISFASPSPAAQQVIEGKLRGLAGDQQVAFTGTAGLAYHRGGGLSGRRWRQLAGYCRPGLNAETDDRFPSSRDRRYHGTPRHQGAPRWARLRAGREHAAGIRPARQSRIGEMGQGDPRVPHQGAMTIVTGRVPVMALARRAICEGPYGMQNPGGSHDFQRTNTLHKP